MRVRSRLLACLVLAASSLGTLAAGSAWAQAPANDTFAQATVISSVPFSQTLDTSEATTDSTDTEALAACGLSIPVAASVWYRYTPSTDQTVVISASGSSYSTGVAVLTGAPGSLSAVTCFAGSGSFSAVAGETYHIGIADIGGGNGGTLNLSVIAVEVDFGVDRFGRFDPRARTATVTGTLTCPAGASGTVDVFLSQRRGRVETGAGFGFTSVACDGTEQQWSAPIQPFNGKFGGGHADVFAGASICGDFGCVFKTVERTIVLRGH
jgi:hypothetical protein